MHQRFCLCLAVLMLVSACGDSRIERTGSGAAIGAGIGVTTGLLCCQKPGGGSTTGLFVGMAVGALIGYLIDEPWFFNSKN